jgi:hypothetical protein
MTTPYMHNPVFRFDEIGAGVIGRFMTERQFRAARIASNARRTRRASRSAVNGIPEILAALAMDYKRFGRPRRVDHKRLSPCRYRSEEVPRSGELDLAGGWSSFRLSSAPVGTRAPYVGRSTRKKARSASAVSNGPIDFNERFRLPWLETAREFSLANLPFFPNQVSRNLHPVHSESGRSLCPDDVDDVCIRPVAISWLAGRELPRELRLAPE